MKIAVGFLLFTLMNNIVWANDLGHYGRVWGIEEVNVKQVIANQLAMKNTLKSAKVLRKSLKTLGEHFPSMHLPTARHRLTSYYDPSIALKTDIVVRGRLLYRKGTWVNPLKVVRPIQDMLYFDGRDKQQLDFAIKALRHYPTRLMLVETGGDPIKLSANLHRPVYYARRAIISRFHIVKVPSLLGVGVGLHQYDLSVTTLTPKATMKTLNTCWHGCPARTNRKEE